MLRRHNKIKMQVHEMLDAVLFGVSFWLAGRLRARPAGAEQWKHVFPGMPLKAVESSFDSYFWLYLLLILACPLVLEAQGFYDRSFLSPRRAVFWPLLRGVAIATLGLVIVLYAVNVQFPRGVAILFGVISFRLVLLKEEGRRAG